MSYHLTRTAIVVAALVMAGCSSDSAPTTQSPDQAAAALAVVCHVDTEEAVGAALRDLAVAARVEVVAFASGDDVSACDLVMVDRATLGAVPSTRAATTPAPDPAAERVAPTVVRLGGPAADGEVGITVQLEEALVAAGYAAAGATRTGTVGAWSTAAVPSELVAAYVAGVTAYNDDNGADVEVLVADPIDADDADAAVDPDARRRARVVVDDLLLDGADAIASLAGATSDVAAEAIHDAGGGRLVWLGLGPDGVVRPAPDDALTLVAIERDLVGLVDSIITRFLAGSLGDVVDVRAGEGLAVTFSVGVPADVRTAATALGMDLEVTRD